MEFTENSDGSEKGKARRLANLKPFRKGKSGNPGGKCAEVDQIRALAQECTPSAFGKIVDLMDSDDARIALMACKEILERALGKPGKAIASDEDGPMVQVNIIRHGEKVPPPCN